MTIPVSPFVKRGTASSTLFDHTSILKTIILKYCPPTNGDVHDWLSARVRTANDLGELLSLSSPRGKPAVPPPVLGITGMAAKSLEDVSNIVENWELDAQVPAPALPSDLQKSMLALATAAREAGVPEDRL